MTAHCRAHSQRVWTSCGAVIVVIASLTSVVLALDKDKALYIGGSRLADFPKGGLLHGYGRIKKVEGAISTKSDSHLTFDAGRSGSLTIGYDAISSLEYGFDVPPSEGKPWLMAYPWDPSDQFGKEPHYLLTITYRGDKGEQLGVVFELGKAIVRPTIETLAARTGKTMNFRHVQACMQYRSAEECGFGAPSELKGLTRTYIDVNRAEDADPIIAELKKQPLGTELLSTADGAEVILKFRDGGSAMNFHIGRGEVYVVREGKLRPVLFFADRMTGARFGRDKISTKFGRAFVEAYRQANARLP